MYLISEETADHLIKELNLEITDDVKKFVIAAINSIDKDELFDILNEKLMRELRLRGVKF